VTRHERAALSCAHGAQQPHVPGRSSATLDVMTRLIALLVAAILSALGSVHIYWALGGRSGAAAAVPELSGRPAFRPSVAGTIVVAIALFAAALLIASAGRLLVDPLPPPTVRVLTFCLGAVFLARAVGDFRLVGFFKRTQGTRFARLDTLVYAPLCLFLGIAAVFVAYHDV
jgi:Protein of unknown function (DUF3995)